MIFLIIIWPNFVYLLVAFDFYPSPLNFYKDHASFPTGRTQQTVGRVH